MTLDTEAQTLVTVLEGAIEPGVPAYIGMPPPEIQKLVRETLDAAQTLDNTIGESGQVSDGMGFAALIIMDLFDQWEPYL